jgi:hypothetical protein
MMTTTTTTTTPTHGVSNTPAAWALAKGTPPAAPRPLQLGWMRRKHRASLWLEAEVVAALCLDDGEVCRAAARRRRQR